MLFSRRKYTLVSVEEALPGRPERPFEVPERHAVLGTPLTGPWPQGMEVAVFAMGCFWGAEELFWRVPGVHSTAVGYAGGITPHPTYEEVCTGATGHTEVVQVVFDPNQVSFDQLLRLFWENHDPTQGYRQGNDIGTQYRSAIYTSTHAQLAAAESTRARYDAAVQQRGYPPITTEITPAGAFYYAEAYHQQYLFTVPNGYRCHANTGIPLPGDGGPTIEG
jgi:peptide-methionine (S)-S-oxide reductase